MSLDDMLGALGPEVGQALEAQSMHVHMLTHGLIKGRERESTLQIAGKAQDLGDSTLEQLSQGESPEDLACKEGCASCCYFHVDATWPEIFQLAETILSTWSEPDRAGLIARLRQTVQKIKGLSIDRRGLARVPCALLKNDRCRLYEQRPLKCRSCTSFSKKACKRSLRPGRAPDIPAWGVPLMAYDPVFVGVSGGLQAAGLAPTVELNAGLLHALTSDSALEDWLAAGSTEA